MGLFNNNAVSTGFASYSLLIYNKTVYTAKEKAEAVLRLSSELSNTGYGYDRKSAVSWCGV